MALDDGFEIVPEEGGVALIKRLERFDRGDRIVECGRLELVGRDRFEEGCGEDSLCHVPL
jgi:hypothetical protein